MTYFLIGAIIYTLNAPQWLITTFWIIFGAKLLLTLILSFFKAHIRIMERKEKGEPPKRFKDIIAEKLFK